MENETFCNAYQKLGSTFKIILTGAIKSDEYTKEELTALLHTMSYLDTTLSQAKQQIQEQHTRVPVL